MKNNAFLISIGIALISLGFLIPVSYSQSCLPDGIIFNTQEEVDDFQLNYPGCTAIEGFVSIGSAGYDNITNLSPLNVLTSIGGDLRISLCDSLDNLLGLENIDSIGGDLVIKSNNMLTSITNMGNAAYIGGNLSIHDNSQLSSCDATSICNYLFAPDGIIDIYDNSDGCSNPAEIASSCDFTMPCLPYGNYYFTSQSEVDNFATDYPGCTDLAGNVNIGSGKGNMISNLQGLNVITSIGGELRIKNNDSLTSLLGLENLISIDGNLIIGEKDIYGEYGNPLLTDLEGLDNLSNVGGRVGIGYNQSLVDLSGLENIVSLTHSLSITENHSLRNLNGLDNLEEVQSLWIGGNDSLTTLSGLGSLQTCHENLSIGYSDDYSGVMGNPSLTTLSALSSLTSVGEYFLVAHNPSLESLQGLNNLDSVDGLGIIENHSLLSMDGLDNLSVIGDGIGTRLVNIIRNNSLSSLSGLENLSTMPNLHIERNAALSSLSGLENLTTITLNLVIQDNDLLRDLNGLNNLVEIAWGLNISQNTSLENLAGLNALTSIGSGIWLEGNPLLQSLSELENLDSIGGDLRIFGNPALSVCAIQSICDYLDNPPGYVEINNNTTGCNSQAEVEDACGAMVTSELGNGFEIAIYPNPARDKISIVKPDDVQIEFLRIINQLGQVVINRNNVNTAIDVSELRSGIYFITIETAAGIIVQKILIK
ncbi:MAG: T9SS type A sorting domain-containing protein [Bacteroidales bacterium]|jgi:hypothetical protein|nr:T9SS type A sorting domain-containing protein [Bacteroidales bacterium]